MLSIPTSRDYVATECLGSGVQATVYAAHSLDGDEDQTFAIKVFDRDDSQSLVEFPAELKALQLTAGHLNIVSLLDHAYNGITVQVSNEVLEGKPVMVFEQCRYGDLLDFMKGHGAVLETKLLKFIFLQVCEGLKALHTKAQLCHLDIKLENVLISEEGTVKLCDFGMVQSTEDQLVISQGTQAYMAPEVFNKNAHETYKGIPADIHSLGVLLWTLHFGMHPFSSSEPSDRYYAFFQRNPSAFWRQHPAIKKQVGMIIDEDFKNLITAML